MSREILTVQVLMCTSQISAHLTMNPDTKKCSKVSASCGNKHLRLVLFVLSAILFLWGVE
jgi:hypothetical protein